MSESELGGPRANEIVCVSSDHSDRFLELVIFEQN